MIKHEQRIGSGRLIDQTKREIIRNDNGERTQGLEADVPRVGKHDKPNRSSH